MAFTVEKISYGNEVAVRASADETLSPTTDPTTQFAPRALNLAYANSPALSVPVALAWLGAAAAVPVELFAVWRWRDSSRRSHVAARQPLE